MVENGLGFRTNNPVGSAPKPGDQPVLPGGVDAPARLAVEVFAHHPVNLEQIVVPDAPTDITVSRSKGLTVFGVLMTSATSAIFGLDAYLLPFVLIAAWVTVALWDLFRAERTRGGVIGWTGAILLIPFLGVLAYYIFGQSQMPSWQRLTLVAGGLGAYLVILAIGAVLGGVV